MSRPAGRMHVRRGLWASPPELWGPYHWKLGLRKLGRPKLAVGYRPYADEVNLGCPLRET